MTLSALKEGDMAGKRWDPVVEMQQLRERMERLLPEGLRWSANAVFGPPRGGAAVDLLELEDAFVVRASLPGVRPDDVRVTLQGHVLTLRGRYPTEEEAPGARWLLRERRGGEFARSLALPAEAEADHATARFRHGVLELRLPKAHVVPARHIPVEGTRPATASQSPNPADAHPPVAPRRTGCGATADDGHGSAAPGYGPRTTADEPDDVVGEASEESFPASDAPSWSRGHS
jgi:HSP20 family protein